jgi:hypothetical protein
MQDSQIAMAFPDNPKECASYALSSDQRRTIEERVRRRGRGHAPRSSLAHMGTEMDKPPSTVREVEYCAQP